MNVQILNDFDGFNLQTYLEKLGKSDEIKLQLFLSQDTGRTPACHSCHSSMTHRRPTIDVSDSSDCDTAYTNYYYVYHICTSTYYCSYLICEHYVLVLLLKRNEIEMSVGANPIA